MASRTRRMKASAGSTGLNSLPSISRPGSGVKSDEKVDSAGTSSRSRPFSGGSEKPVKDKDTEDEMVEQRNELARRAEYIQGVQRNYDALAQLCSKNMNQIQVLTDELESTKATLVQLKKSESDFASGKETVVKLKQDSTKLQTVVKDLDDTNKQLNKKCLDYQSHVADLNDIKEELSRQVEEMQALAQSRKDEIADLQFMLKDDSGQRELQVLQMNNNQTASELNEALQNVARLARDLKKSTLQVQKLQNMNKRLEMDRDNFMNDVTRIKDRTTTTRTDLVATKKLLEEEKQKSESLEIDCHALNSELKMLAHLGPELEEKLRFAESTRRALQDQYDVLWNEKGDVDMSLKEAEEQSILLKIQLGKVTSDGVRSKEELERQLDAAINGKTDLVKTNSDLSIRIAKLEATLGTDQSEFEELQKKNQRLRKHRNELEAKINDMEREADMWADQKNRLLKKQSANSTLLDEISALKAEIEKLNLMCSDKDHENTIQKSEVTQLQADLHRMRSEAGDVNGRIQRAVEEALRGVQQKHDEKISKFEVDISMLSRKLMTAEKARQELTAMLEEQRKPKAVSSSAVDLAKLRKKEVELESAIAKIIAVEEASEASFTCVHCLELFDNAVTCIPCGHSYCHKCIESTKTCPQCGPKLKVTYYPNELLEDLTTKFRFRKTSLAGLKTMVKKTKH